jgi:hypothetical protein
MYALNTLFAGLVRIPSGILNLTAVILTAELARRGFVQIAGRFFQLEDKTKEGSAAYYLDKYTPLVAKDMCKAFENQGALSLVQSAVICTVLSNIGWAAAGYLFGPPSSYYNKVLEWIGPFKLDTAYIYPAATLVMNWANKGV